MKSYCGFRNFRQFERRRSDIRLPYALLNDERFRQLRDAHKAHLICLLLLAARSGNVLPISPVKLGALIGASEPIDIAQLTDFIEIVRPDRLTGRRESERRPVSDRVRALVLVRDGGRCRNCGSARNLEIDHVVPFSKGGTGDEDNLQTLCRRCNRRKWRKLVPRL